MLPIPPRPGFGALAFSGGFGYAGLIPSGGINPKRLPGIMAWYDASDLSSIVSTGGLVSQWSDKSGNGYHATQGTAANQPTTGSRTINGKNALAFDGTSDMLNLPAALYSLPNGPSTVYILAELDNGGDATQRILNGQDAGTGRYYLDWSNSSGAFTGNNNAAGTGPTSELMTKDFVQHLLVYTRSGTAQSINVDGGAGGSNTSATSFTATQLTLGAQAVNSNRLFGLIGEVIICNQLHSAYLRNQVGASMRRKWATRYVPI